jgi:hypothetical protein
MFYNLLGRVVWFAVKTYLHRKYGPTYVPKSLLAGVTVAVAVGAGVLVAKARSADE